VRGGGREKICPERRREKGGGWGCWGGIPVAVKGQGGGRAIKKQQLKGQKTKGENSANKGKFKKIGREKGARNNEKKKPD